MEGGILARGSGLIIERLTDELLLKNWRVAALSILCRVCDDQNIVRICRCRFSYSDVTSNPCHHANNTAMKLSSAIALIAASLVLASPAVVGGQCPQKSWRLIISRSVFTGRSEKSAAQTVPFPRYRASSVLAKDSQDYANA